MPYTRSRLPTELDFETIERTTAMVVPKDIRDAYLRMAGHIASGIGTPFGISYPDGTESDDLLQRFLLADEIVNQWPHIGYIVEFATHFDLDSDFVEPATLLPFADCADGCIYASICGKLAGKFYYADNGDFGIALLASGATALAELLGFSAT